jgi:hypothetical protein
MADEKTGTSGTAQPSSGAGVSQQTGATEGAIPKGLERFAGSDGKVDINKIGASYLELEKSHYQQGQKYSTLEKAYKTIADKVEAPRVDPDEARGREFDNFTQDPKGYTEKVASQTLAEGAAPIMNAILTMAHPELNDPAFRQGLDEFAATLPPALKGNLMDFQHADWAIKLYKQQLGARSASPGSALPHTESPSASHGTEGKTFTRSEIKEMMYKRPGEYAARADEIAAAYRENRVKPD